MGCACPSALCGVVAGIPNNRAMTFVPTCKPSSVLRCATTTRTTRAAYTARTVTLAALSSCLLAACSPALNWRDIAVPDSTLRAMLPCDPKTVTRTLDKGPAPGMGPVQLSATGCDAAGSTYAVSHFLVTQPERAGEALGYWQATVRQLASAPAGGESAAGAADAGAGAAATTATTAFVPRGALNMPQSIRGSFELQAQGGGKQPVQGAWFARAEPGGVRLYSALIYDGKPSAEQQQMFFDGLQLQ